jgi:L-ascorbate metabolism protein UlaG (beta-lactamase superfamily)
MMETKPLKIRWLNDACYQILLPNGKSLLIDPYIDESPYRVLSSEDIQSADYILVSHTHFDHVLDIAKISERFDSKIFVGQASGLELARCYDIPSYRMFWCSAGTRLEMPDFTLDCYSGKHTKLGDFDRPSRWPENIRKDGLDPNTVTLNMLGSYEYMIYRLTLPDHTRILVWGGGATEEAIAQAKEFQPDISIAQLPRETTDQVARLYAAIGGKIIFPHHHDFFMNKGEEGMRVIQETVDKTSQLAPFTLVVCPQKGKWYSIKTGVTPDEE